MTRQKTFAPAGLEPPATYPLTIRNSLAAYNMNRMAFSLRHTRKREEFQRDPRGYMRLFGLSEEEQKLILDHDWHGCLARGMNRNLLLKIAGALGVSIMQQAADFRGQNLDQFKALFPRKGPGPVSREDL